LPFLFNRSAFIANLLIEKVPLLSVGIRRLLSGSDFIEGDWPLVVMEEGKPIPKYFGFLTIAYEGGQLRRQVSLATVELRQSQAAVLVRAGRNDLRANDVWLLAHLFLSRAR
jgi:hypothetical protein